MSMQKRSHETLDPDYTDDGDQQAKRQRVLEQDAKETVSKKIQGIIKKEFEKEIINKETELEIIDARLNEAMLQMDRLRACIVATYYGQRRCSGSSQVSSIDAPPPSIHPTVKKYLGKAPKGQSAKPDASNHSNIQTTSHERLGMPENVIIKEKSVERNDIHTGSKHSQLPVSKAAANSGPLVFEERHARFKTKRKIIVGNVSKYIPVDNREANDMSSHKWMVYVRGPKSDPDISSFVCKVWFFLHHSYKPNDLVEISSQPFHLTRRGWGEFPIRVQLHFVDHRNKKVDIIHHLKLDKTFSGLQTLGAETVVEVEIEKEESVAPVPGNVCAVTLPAFSQPSVQVSVKKVESLQDYSTCVPASTEKTYQSEESSGQVSSANLGSCDKSQIKTEPEEASDCLLPDASEEYNMTFVHDQIQDNLKREIEREKDQDEGDQEVDVGEETTIKTSTDVHGGTVFLSSSGMLQVPSVDSQHYIHGQSSALSSSSISSPKVVKQEPLSSSLGTSSLEPSAASIRTVPCTRYPSTATSCLLSSCSELASSLSTTSKSKSSIAQSQRLTVIKDPARMRAQAHLAKVHSAPCHLESTMSATNSNVISALAGHTNGGGVTYSSSEAGARVTSLVDSEAHSKVMAVSDSATIVENRNSFPTLPSGSVHGNHVLLPVSVQQPQQVVVPRMVVVKPPFSLPKKIVSVVNSPKPMDPMSSSSLLLSAAGASLLQPHGYENSKDTKYCTTKLAPVSSAINGLQTVVITSTVPSVSLSSSSLSASSSSSKSGAPRQVSLLTGLVVGSPSSSLPKQLMPPYPSALSSPNVSVSSNDSRLVSNSLGSARQVNLAQQILLVNKAGINACGSSPLSSSPSSASLLPQGHTLIKALNKNFTPQTPAGVVLSPQSSATCPVQLIKPIIRKQTQPVSLISPTPVTQGTDNPHSNNPVARVVISHPTLNTGAALSSRDNTGIISEETKPLVQQQLVLSFPGGGTPPVAADPPQKMSAVGITKYGKGYRSILPPQRSRKAVSEEDRLKGQYDILRAFKENPQLYTKKSKKVILASSDTALLDADAEEDTIPHLKLEDYPTMKSLVKAGVRRHPLIQAGVNKLLHPYCAESREQWDSWAIGKQRASQWHRACFTLRYLQRCLGGQSDFKGETLMTKGQLVDWCRHHAFSPELPVKPRHTSCKSRCTSTVITANVAESFYLLQLKLKPQSLSRIQEVHDELVVGQAEVCKYGTSLEDEGEAIEIVARDGDELQRNIKMVTSVKEEISGEGLQYPDWPPPSDGAVFVDDQLRKRGIRLKQHRLENGVIACSSAEIIYKAMQEFCLDILREALAASQCSTSGDIKEITGRDIHQGLMKLPEASFCRNRFLGKQQEPNLGYPVSR